MYKAIALDAFGTVCDIHDRRNPYHRLFQLSGADYPQARIMAMTTPITFEELARNVSAQRPELSATIEQLIQDVAAEVRSIKLYPEVLDVLHTLQSRRLKLAIVSNLAQPYGAVIEQLLSQFVTTFVFSYNVGAVKPDAKIFSALSNSLQLPPAEILVVGNSLKNDFLGARIAGMPSLYLDRNLRRPDGKTITDLTGILYHI